MLLPARTGAAGVARRQPGRPLGMTRGTWLLIGITIVAAALRFATISSQSYWLDESQAAHEMQLSFGAMLGAWSTYEWNPPLYAVLLWPWAKVFGTGAIALRTLSALLGTAFIPLMYLCTRELVSRRAGIVAAMLAAVNPFMIWYSQEAREYMLLMVLCAGSVLFFARAWRSRSRRELLWWTALSILALLTQYYAGFLIAAEGLALVSRIRSRVSLAALGAIAAVEATLIPHVLPRLQTPVPFIVDLPLSVRLQQVPVSFSMNTLYQSGLVSYGLLGAAVLAAALIALLVSGGSRRELRGAGIAALLAAAVLLVPLLLALAGHDDYLARGLMPGWIPLAIVIAAACTASRVQVWGAALGVALLAMFVYAGIRIDRHPESFQKPDWRGVAAALGRPTQTRAIVAYDGQTAAGPLSIYLPGVPWSGPGAPLPGPTPLAVGEVDIVASTSAQLAPLPAGVSLIGAQVVDGQYRVDRFALAQPWRLSSSAIAARARTLLAPGPPGPWVMIQRPSA